MDTMDIMVNGLVKATYEIAGDKAVLLCPPHPLMGGNRFDVRLERICRELHAMEFSTLRFDYRSPYRNGTGEIEDARLCLRYLKERHSFVAVIGYSFGSIVASNVADEGDALALISPLQKIDEMSLKDVGVPKLVIYASRDDIVPIGESRRIAEALSEPKKVLELDTDHFYFGKFDELSKAVAKFLGSLTVQKFKV
jgi:hypothetical protein